MKGFIEIEQDEKKGTSRKGLIPRSLELKSITKELLDLGAESIFLAPEAVW